MNIVEVMTKKVFTVTKKELVKNAFQLMADKAITHLPVVEKKSLVGIISDRDVRQAILPWKPSDISDTFYNVDTVKVEDIMSKDLITISSNAHVEDAAKIFYTLKIGSLPVVDEVKLLGIITESDILGIFIEMMGLLESSCRLDVLIGKSSGSFDEVSAIIRNNSSKIISYGMAPAKRKDKTVYFFRLEQCDTRLIVEELNSHGYKVISVLS